MFAHLLRNCGVQHCAGLIQANAMHLASYSRSKILFRQALQQPHFLLA